MIALPLAGPKKRAAPSLILPKPTAYRPKLTVLSFGGGQDSTAILYILAFNVLFRRVWAPEDLLVIMSDTGNEHPATYMHVQSVIEFCDKHGIEFVFLTKDVGLHGRSWQSLTEQFALHDTIMSRFFPKTCTDNLKIQPIYRYLNHWVSVKYGIPREGGTYRGKRALVEFAEKYGPIRVLLGIAKGEETRLQPKHISHQWMRLAIDKAYPLIWLEWDRAACQGYIREQGMIVPPPSNCMFCPFMNKIELLWLARSYPSRFAEWCEFERRKLKRFAHKGKSNYGVLHQTKTLQEVLADAERQYGDWTLDQLEEYRFSHGHCVKSRY
jgi:3'-phosphoadenosine 5'-phosphosulfate sulfotransferase (PAPS reductase)/FAD synthetase